MDIILAILFAVTPDPIAAAGLQRTSPTWGDASHGGTFTIDMATDHLVSARVGVLVAGLPPRWVPRALAIAHHESRYTLGKIQREPSGCHKGVCREERYSCGVMTPEPVWAKCPVGRTLAEEYEEGARHLAEWLVHRGNEMGALDGYAGGKLDDQVGNAGLYAWEVFERRARKIQLEMRQRPPAPSS